MRGEYFSVFLSNFNVATEVHAEADLDDDEVALFFVKGGRIGGGSVWDPFCIDEVRCCAMSGFEHHLGFSPWEDPIRYAAWCRGALCVSVGGGETPMVVSRVLGYVCVSPTADILRRG